MIAKRGEKCFGKKKHMPTFLFPSGDYRLQLETWEGWRGEYLMANNVRRAFRRVLRFWLKPAFAIWKKISSKATGMRGSGSISTRITAESTFGVGKKAPAGMVAAASTRNVFRESTFLTWEDIESHPWHKFLRP